MADYVYADIDDLIKDLLPASIGNADEKAAILRVLQGASNFIDKFTRRPEGFFLPAPEDLPENYTPRIFRGEGKRFLRLPPYVGTASIEGIEADNIYKNTNSGWIYFKRGNYAFPGTYPFYETVFTLDQIYTVSARWGFNDTPAAIREAARELTVRLWQTQRGIFGQLTPDGTVIERAMPPFVEEALLTFRRRQFEVT